MIADKLKVGKDLRVVQVFAGHRQPSSTEACRTNRLEELIVAVAKLGTYVQEQEREIVGYRTRTNPHNLQAVKWRSSILHRHLMAFKKTPCSKR